MSYGILRPELGSHKNDTYGFVNETAVRVGAGIMFTLGFFTFLNTWYSANYLFAFVIVVFYWLDFTLKIINPQISLVSNIAQFLVKHKPVIWVGAVQKRFAGFIGWVFSGIVMLLIGYRIFFGEIFGGIGSFSLPMVLCMMCLIFMWLEAILGYCVGCDIYAFLVKKHIIGGLKGQNCPDGKCEVKL